MSWPETPEELRQRRQIQTNEAMADLWWGQHDAGFHERVFTPADYEPVFTLEALCAEPARDVLPAAAREVSAPAAEEQPAAPRVWHGRFPWWVWRAMIWLRERTGQWGAHA